MLESNELWLKLIQLFAQHLKQAFLLTYGTFSKPIKDWHNLTGSEGSSLNQLVNCRLEIIFLCNDEIQINDFVWDSQLLLRKAGFLISGSDFFFDEQKPAKFWTFFSKVLTENPQSWCGISERQLMLMYISSNNKRITKEHIC